MEEKATRGNSDGFKQQKTLQSRKHIQQAPTLDGVSGVTG